MGNQKTIRILIAEDDYLVGKSTAALLRTMGYTVVGQALDGREAVEMTQSLQPDVILMDIKMPVMGGIEATRHIYETCPTPVVALTAYAMPEVIERAIAAGVGAYLTKPASPQEMERAINVTIARFDDMIELRRLNTELQAEVTERKQAEDALRESEEKYRTILENIEDSYFEVDVAGNFTFFNDSLCRLLGYSEDELMGMNNRQYTDDENARKVYQTFNAVYRTGNPIEIFDWEVIRKDGTRRFIEASVSLIRGSKGEPAGFRGIIRDVTERKRAEEEIRRRNRELAALNSITAAMMQSALNLDEVLQLTADGIVEGLGCNTAFIFLLDEEVEVFRGGAVSTSAKMLARVNALIGSPLLQIKIPARRDFNEAVRNLLNGRTTIKHDFYELVGPLLSRRVASTMQRFLDSRTFFTMPLLAKGKTIGGIVASTPDELSEGDTEKIMTFANQAAIAIENARLYETERRRSAELEALRQASLHLTSSLDLQPILEAILDHAFKLVAADDVHIFLYDGERLTFGAALWEDGRQQKPYAELRPQGLTYTVARSGERIVIPDVSSHPLFRDYQWGGSIVGLPLRVGERVVGVMNIAFDRPHALDESELRVLGLLANQAAIAIENARLYEETRQSALEQETLREAALALTTALDRNEVIERILAQLQRVVPYDSASIQLLQGNMLVLIAGRGFPNLEQLLGTSFPASGDNPNREVIRTLSPSILEDAPVLYEAFTQEPFAAMGIRSWLGVPMLIGNRTVGMITLDKRQPGFYTQEHARLAEAFAAQAAVAFENARLFEEEKRRSTQLALINEVGEKAASILKPDRLMQEVTRSIRESFNYYNVALLLLDEERQEVVMQAVSGGFEHLLPGEYRQSLDVGIVGFVARTGKSRLASDVSKDPHYSEDPLEEVLTQSELCVPIKQDNEVIGVLDMQSVHLNAFDQADVVVMEAVADRIAVALENARLFEEEKRRNTQLALINEVSEKAASILDSDRLMQEATRSIQESFNYYNVTLFLLDEERREVVVQAVAGGFEHIIAGDYHQSLDEGIIGLVARTGKSWLAGDVSKDPYYVEGFLEEALNKSELCVPIKLGEKVIGALDVQSIHLNAFDQADVVVMEAVADRVAMGIQNARLYEEMAGLYDIGLAVTSALELDKTLRAIYDQVNRLMRLDTFYIALYDETRRELRFDIFIEEGEWLPKFTKKLDEGGLTTWIVQSKKPLFIGDFEKESPPVTPGQVGKSETQSWLGFPLLVRDKVVGVISVQSFRSHAFTEGNRRTLSAFANQAAIAIENARLYEETQQRALQLQTVEEVGRRVSSILDPDELFTYVTQAIQQNFGYQHVDIFLVEPATGYAIFKASSNPTAEKMWREQDLRFKIGEEGMIGWATHTGESLLANDLSQEPRYVQDELLPETKSELVVPLKVGERVVGVLDVASNELNSFAEDDLFVLQTLANQIAIAIENARLYEDTKRRVEELSLLFQAARDTSASLEPAEVMRRLAEAVCQAADATSANVLVLDETGTRATVLTQYNGPEANPAESAPDEGTVYDLTGYPAVLKVIRTGQPVITHVDDPALDPNTREMMVQFDGCSAMRLPLLVGGALRGYVMVWDSRWRHEWDDDTVRLCQTLAGSAAVALENARLFEEIKKRRMYLEGVLGAAPDAIVTLDAHHRVVEWNAGAEKLFGYSPEEVIGKDTDDLITSPDVLEEAVGLTQMAQGGRETPPTEVVRYRKDGSPVDVIVAGSPILVGDELIGTVVVYTDITEQVRAEREIEERRVYLEGVLREAPDAIVTLDAHHRIVEWNTGAEKLFGYSRGVAIGRDLDPLITNPDVFEEAVGFTQMALNGKAVPPVETIRYRKDGSPVDVLVAASPIMVGDELIGIVAVYTDITERVRMEETLRALALIDDLTSLYNRRGFVTLGQQQLKAASRTKRRMVLLFADFDGLKLINDAFGHSEGDRALIETADALRETFRESDIIARIGGDEFVVLAIETNGSPAEVLAIRFQENLKARNVRENRHYRLSLSVGLARYDPEHPCSIDELLTQADRAMYEQKRDDTSG